MLERVGYHAATRQSWQRDSIRTTIAELRDANPQATEDRLIKLFAERMKEDDDLLNAAAEYAVINAVNSIARTTAVRQSAKPEERTARAQQQTMLVESIKEQIMILNTEMPNGKRMRWCTGAEMVKFGGAFQRIGKKVGSTNTVGSVMDEKQVRQIMAPKQ